MTSNFKLTLLSSVAAAAVTMMAAGTANATFGMLPHCVGTVKCGMGGAGSAKAAAAVDAAANPALAAKMGNTYQVNLGYFKADVKGMSTFGSGTEQTSSADGFPNGSLGVNYKLDENSSFNLSIVPGGGGASDWASSRTNGVFGTGATNDQHVTYEMMYIQPSYAIKMGTASYGVGAILSRATMNTDSVDGTFAPTPNPSTDETFYGVGLQVGGVWDIKENGSFAVNLRSPVWHQKAGSYDGNVFTDPIDTPAQALVGVAFDVTDSTMLAFDAKWVGWSKGNTIGNSPVAGASAGFGWEDQVIFMIGVEHDVDEALTLRAGYSHGNSPITEGTVVANFLFPAIVEDHFTVGASYDIGGGMVLGASAYYAPEKKLVDDGSVMGGFGPGSTGSYLTHSQKGFQVSFSNEF